MLKICTISYSIHCTLGIAAEREMYIISFVQFFKEFSKNFIKNVLMYLN